MSEISKDLKSQFSEKDLSELMNTFNELKTANENLLIALKKKDLEIQTLKSQLELKETQVETISGIIKTKDDQISSLQQTMKMKDEQIYSLKQTIELKQNEIETIKQSKSMIVDESIIKEKDEKIKKLEEEIKILNMDIKLSDEEITKLNKEIEELKSQIGTKEKSVGKICQMNVSRNDIINFMIDIINKSIHTLNITTPNIIDLAQLQLYDVKNNVNIKASCNIDLNVEEHKEILQEFQALDNISLRLFPDSDRWVCLKDGDELFLAVIGKDPENNLAIYTKDPNHIKFFNSIVMESWLRGRKI